MVIVESEHFGAPPNTPDTFLLFKVTGLIRQGEQDDP